MPWFGFHWTVTKAFLSPVMQLQFCFPIDSLIIVVEILPQDTDDAFYIVDLADVLLKHQKWVSLLPRVEPFYGWYLGKIRVAFAVDWQ